MMTRDITQSTYRAGCEGAPPPLHIVDDNPQSAWWPLARPDLHPLPPGPSMVTIPSPAPFGDDPLDPANQTVPRHPTFGMVGRLNFGTPQSNIDAQGVRRR